LTTDIARRALRRALVARPVAPGPIHPSAPGVQDAPTAYTPLLHAARIRIGMSRQGTPHDNARAERFFQTLKYEAVSLRESDDLADARRRIGCFLGDTYNRKRRHSALGYRPPAEFEQTLQTGSSA